MRNQYNVHYKGTKFATEVTLEMAVDIARATLEAMPKTDLTTTLRSLRDLGGVVYIAGVPCVYKSILDLGDNHDSNKNAVGDGHLRTPCDPHEAG